MVEEIVPATESFAVAVFSDEETRKNLISPDLAPGNFQRWLYGTARRALLCVEGRPIGVVSIVGQPPRCFFGYALAPEFRGRGLASRCLEAVERHVAALGFRTLTTNVAGDNQRSIRALERAGFRKFQWFEKGGH